MTSVEELVKVCLHVALSVDPAATVAMELEGVVGLGPPLQAM